MATIGGITCRDRPGSGSVSVAGGKAVGKRILLCDWDDRFDLKDALLGGSLRGPGGVEVGFLDGETFPGWDDLVAIAVDIEGYGNPDSEDADEGPVYPKAILTVTYEPLMWTPGASEGDRIKATEVREHSIEVLMLPGGGFEWADDASNKNTAVSQEVPLYMTVTSRIFTRSDLEDVPDAVQEELGKVNDDVFLGAAAGTMLYAGATVERRLGRDGVNNYQVRYVFKQKDHSWNELFHPVDQVWRGIRRIGGGDPPFDETDFDTILTGV